MWHDSSNFRSTEAFLDFETALILHGIDTTMYWKLSTEILVYIDMITSQFVQIFSATHTWCESPVPPIVWIYRALLDLVTVKAIQV